MAEVVYIGRQRHPVRILVYGILTFGIYGRVLLYRLLHEFDGHLVLFLNRRPYLALLLLPLVGPFFVRRKVVRLLAETIRADATSDRLYPGRLQAWGLIPIVPWFHVQVQQYLNHHWKMLTKRDELRVRTGELDRIKPRARSKDALERVQALEKDVKRRTKELEDLESAARALREAEAVQASVDKQLRSRGMGRGISSLKGLNPLSRLRRRSPATEEVSPPEPEGTTPAPSSKKASASQRGPEPTAAAESGASAAGSRWKRLTSPFARRGLAAEKASKPAPEKMATASWKDRWARRKEERAKRKEQKAAQKEARQKAKLAAKEKKAADKEKRRLAKEQEKAAKKAAKKAGKSGSKGKGKGAPSPKSKKRKSKS